MHDLLACQRGVISRRQVLDLEGKDNDIRRLLRQRRWARVHEGVFVNHTGPLSWEQRAWAAVLYCAPAALAGRSAIHAHGLRGHDRPDRPVMVCVDETRFVQAPTGIQVSRVKHFDERCQLHLSPPRMRIEHALVTEAARRHRADSALAVLGDAVQQGRTTAGRLDDALGEHPRLRHRRLLTEILSDVSAGTYSALEHHYLVDVERPHGLPVASRQRRVRMGKTIAFRDVDYVDVDATVELDGRVGHEESLDRWADLDRDLATVVGGGVTLRVGWKQVLEPCRLASIVGGVLLARGWDAKTRPCGAACNTLLH